MLIRVIVFVGKVAIGRSISCLMAIAVSKEIKPVEAYLVQLLTTASCWLCAWGFLCLLLFAICKVKFGSIVERLWWPDVEVLLHEWLHGQTHDTWLELGIDWACLC